jgi:glyoxylase-like metal-dependent hydrolase (beta-lactamase superfamily II)
MVVTVDLIDRGRIVADRAYVVDGLSTGSRRNPDPDHDIAEFVVWNAVVDGPERTVLWDTGSHPEAGAGHWPPYLYEAFEHVDAADHALADDLQAAGWSLSDVDAVVVSHLHLDHAGGLHEFAGTEVPVYVHADELGYAYLSAKTDAGSVAYVAADFDHDLNWRVIHGDHRLDEGFDLLHLPGHTPGMLGARLETADGPVLFTGDVVYDEANWTDEAALSTSLLADSAAWHDSLRRLKELQRRSGADVLFGHDLARFESHAPGWGQARIVR